MTGDLPALIASVFQALRVAGQAKAEKTAAAPVPAAPIRKSVVPLSMVGIWRPLGGNGGSGRAGRFGAKER